MEFPRRLSHHHQHSFDWEIRLHQPKASQQPSNQILTFLERNLVRLQSCGGFGRQNKQFERWNHPDFLLQQSLLHLRSTAGLLQVRVVTFRRSVPLVLANISHIEDPRCLLVCLANQRWIKETASSPSIRSFRLFWCHNEALHWTAGERKSCFNRNEFLLLDQETDSEREL